MAHIEPVVSMAICHDNLTMTYFLGMLPFSADTSNPFGVPLFWPFNAEYYMSPVSLFRDVQRNQDTIGTFFASIINNNNAWGIAVESLFSGTILFAILAFKKRTKPLLALSCFFISILCGLFYFGLQIKPNLIV
ncbi:MAG: hypothetical protein BA873_12630 [Desulfobulbaceae bacterium C00003063]|nr:MAG: hypothetical protein BA873_12630 [Desulfobulbaceae bacterium C00003063]